MPRRESEVEAPSNNREVTKDEYIHWIGIYLLLRADFVVPMSCCVRVSVYDVSVTMDLLQGGDVGATPNPQTGGAGAVFVWPYTWNLPSKVGPNRDRVKNHG